jgi:hypothetical protein
MRSRETKICRGSDVAFGYSVYHTVFFIIVPIICGGTGEGILPMILAPVVFKYLRAQPDKLEKGSKRFYKLIFPGFIWSTMIGLGTLHVQLDTVASVFSVGYVVACASGVGHDPDRQLVEDVPHRGCNRDVLSQRVRWDRGHPLSIPPATGCR